jgi:uridine kinase
MDKIKIIGIAGGSGSGKTYFARELLKNIGDEHCALIYQDNFYIDQSSRFDFDGGSVNFDHPSALDFDLLAERLQSLKSGNLAEIPIYDFATHSRLKKTIPQNPKKIILVDGILIFHPENVRSLFDEMIFFDTPEELRFKRRLERDVHERGRTPEGVHNQFFKQVKPMHDMFVEPSKNFADYIVKDFGDYNKVLETFTAKFKYLLEK